MANKTKVTPYSSFTVKFFDNKIEVDMEHFEKITLGKIQTTYPLIMDEWHRQQQVVLIKQRKKEQEAAAEAAQQMETTDG
ncbi:hypothetical protein LCGC14_0914350 [marine sediment metagenome]|uniref:Uncharacterized protein n=1 Tax=marine sediment metagenome TaxID=412755 RepID=A0A0F9PDE0_9ZZZZ